MKERREAEAACLSWVMALVIVIILVVYVLERM